MREREFKEIKERSPEGKIGQRTWNYQKTRDALVKALKSGDEKGEKLARMNYLIEKAFSKDIYGKQDYDFILGLEKEDLEKFFYAVRSGVVNYRYKIWSMSEIHEDSPDESDVEALFAGNKILRFIGQTRNDVISKPYRINSVHTHVNGGESRNDDMKKIYPNREEMVSKNESEKRDKAEKLKEKRKNSLRDKKRQDIFEIIYGNKDAVIKDLRENFVTSKDTIKKINTGERMENVEGKEIHFELPAVGDFKGFKFDYFVSNNAINEKVLKINPDLQNQLYSMKEISDLLSALREYMKEYDIKIDGDGSVDYENKLKSWKTDVYETDAGNCLNEILGLNNYFWLKDKTLIGQENGLNIKFRPHIVFRCDKLRNCFDISKDPLTFDNIREGIGDRLLGAKSFSRSIDNANFLIKLS